MVHRLTRLLLGSPRRSCVAPGPVYPALTSMSRNREKVHTTNRWLVVERLIRPVLRMRLRRKEADKGRKRAALPAWARSQPKTNRKGFNRTWPPGQRALEKRTIQKATTIEKQKTKLNYQTYWFLRHNGLIMYSTSLMVDGRHHDWECRSSGRKWVWGLRLLVLQPGQPKPFPCTLPAVCGHISIVSVNCRRRPSIISIKQ